jgi:glycosyltransferase involved in cell wall biosynthesis
MRIGQMISGRGLDGTSRYCQLIARGLAARGHEITLFHRPGAWIAANLDPNAVHCVETTFERKRAELLRVRGIIRELSTDVLQTHHSSANMFGMLMRWSGVRRVATGHACHFNPAWFFADRLIAPTQEVARYHHWVNWVPTRRIALVPNFIDIAPPPPDREARRAEFRRQLAVGDHEVLVGMVGSIVPRKRHRDLVEAVALAREQIPGLKLVLAGGFADGAALEELQQAIRLSGVGSHVSIRVDVPDIDTLMAALDIYAFSSNFEAGPLSILEAMAARLPVVTTDVGAARLFVRPGETGEIVEPPTAAALGRAIADLAQDADRRRRYGEAGRRRVAEHFSLEAAAARIEAVLAEAARSSGAGG